MKSLVFGRTTARDRGLIQLQEKPWPEIVDLFRDPVVRSIKHAQYLAMPPKGRSQNKNTGLFFGGRCKDGQRTDGTLVSRSIVNLDLDSDCDQLWLEFCETGKLSALDGLSYLIHSTRSHTDEKPKFRILIPLDREVDPAEYEPVARALAHKLDTSMKAVARESYVPAQGMYFPSVSSDQQYHFAAFDETLFDPDDALTLYPAEDATKWPKRREEKVTVYVAGRKITHPEDKKTLAPIITAVHRAFDPWTFIEEFLSDVYLPSGDRYYPVGSTGAPSVRIYDDAFIHSDHGSDRAVGQHNTFDLGRIHLFGDKDSGFDTESMTPSEWPSYKAMVEFMMTRPEVVEQLEQIQEEVEQERNGSMMSMLDELGDDEETSEADALLDDLIGDVEPKRVSIEDVLARVRKSIRRATSLDDLERRLEIIRAFPSTDFRDLHRDLVAVDVQEKFVELAGEKITKATARKMLSPSLQNLREQMKGKPLPEWVKDWVFVASENRFLNTFTKEMLPREGFNGRYAVHAGREFGVNHNGMSIITPVDAALSVFDVPKAYSTGYHPGKPEMYEEEGVLLANTYRAAIVESGSYKGSEGVKLLKRLLTDLFPNRDHRCMLMDFIVHVIRHPEKKLKYAMLIKGSEDEGKSLIADLMTKLLGERNCSLVSNDQLKEKFNGWAAERLLCVVEEIRIPGKEAYEVLNKLKPLTTNPAIPVRKMNKDTERMANFSNLYITTNHEDCLPMEEDNSRYCVLFTRFRTNAEVKAWHAKLKAEEGRVYTRELWEHVHYRPGQFIEAFNRYEFSEFYDPSGRAPDTVFKRMMAEDSKTEERQLLETLLESGRYPTITDDILVWSSVQYEMSVRGIGTYLKGRGVAGFLKPLGFIKTERVNMQSGNGRTKLTVWTRNPKLVGPDNQLTEEGLDALREALAKEEDDDELGMPDSNVVPIRGR